MKFEVTIEREFPHLIEEVWSALTTNAGISAWLLETSNFEAKVGHVFEMTCVLETGEVDIYRCEVLALDRPDRMVWSWVLVGNEDKGLTEVEFRLAAADNGTRVTLVHRGDRDQAMLERFKSGWPYKLDQLAVLLAKGAGNA